MTTAPSRYGRIVFWVALLVVWGLTTHAKYSVDGDEPHYLIATASLLTDGDLDVANNYARDDGAHFGREGVRADDFIAQYDRSGVLRPAHDVGLSVLLVPAYALATGLSALVPDAALARMKQSRGLLAYALITLVMAALSAWVAVVLLGLLAPMAGAPVAAAFALATVLTPPVLSNAFLVYPEVPALLVTALALRTAWRTRPPGWKEAVVVLACLGALPWLHRKFLPFAWALAFVVAFRQYAWLRSLSVARRWTAVAAFAIPQFALAVSTFVTWGNLGGPLIAQGTPLSLAAIGPGLGGLFMDRENGLLAWAPVAVVLPLAGALALTETWPLLLPAAALCLPSAAHDHWWGGWSPAGRFLVPLAPLAVLVVAKACSFRRVRWTAAALMVPQVALAVYAWQHPRVLWPTGNGENAALAAIPGWGAVASALLPSVRTSPASVPRAWLLIAIWLALGLALALVPPRRMPSPGSSAGR